MPLVHRLSSASIRGKDPQFLMDKVAAKCVRENANQHDTPGGNIQDESSCYTSDESSMSSFGIITPNYGSEKGSLIINEETMADEDMSMESLSEMDGKSNAGDTSDDQDPGSESEDELSVVSSKDGTEGTQENSEESEDEDLDNEEEDRENEDDPEDEDEDVDDFPILNHIETGQHLALDDSDSDESSDGKRNMVIVCSRQSAIVVESSIGNLSSDENISSEESSESEDVDEVDEEEEDEFDEEEHQEQLDAETESSKSASLNEEDSEEESTNGNGCGDWQVKSDRSLSDSSLFSQHDSVSSGSKLSDDGSSSADISDNDNYDEDEDSDDSDQESDCGDDLEQQDVVDLSNVPVSLEAFRSQAQADEDQHRTDDISIEELELIIHESPQRDDDISELVMDFSENEKESSNTPWSRSKRQNPNLECVNEDEEDESQVTSTSSQPKKMKRSSSQQLIATIIADSNAPSMHPYTISTCDLEDKNDTKRLSHGFPPLPYLDFVSQSSAKHAVAMRTKSPSVDTSSLEQDSRFTSTLLHSIDDSGSSLGYYQPCEDSKIEKEKSPQTENDQISFASPPRVEEKTRQQSITSSTLTPKLQSISVSLN